MVEIVRQIQPHGPYILGGWSAGGMYAFEAARQILEAGEKVASLILIDSPCRLRFGPMPHQVLDLVSENLTLGNEVRQHFLETIAAVSEYTPRPLKKNSFTQVTIIWATDGLEKTMEFLPRATDLNYDDAIVEWLLRRAGPLDAMGWDKLLPDFDLEIRTTKGNHFSMIQALNVSDTLRNLSKLTNWVSFGRRTLSAMPLQVLCNFLRYTFQRHVRLEATHGTRSLGDSLCYVIGFYNC
jgi:iron transport multicopper oxidase